MAPAPARVNRDAAAIAADPELQAPADDPFGSPHTLLWGFPRARGTAPFPKVNLAGPRSRFRDHENVIA
jgi:hypothetical protein